MGAAAAAVGEAAVGAAAIGEAAGGSGAHRTLIDSARR
ncbi:hypothetical protein BMAPRL20_0123 [Burkholderia mallei PRL-20]|nr:hypothetical protein BMASAVP1_1237 [Burkholderia mallei SAVP1]ABO01575.1 hypothetical protein BMA10247_A0093 [Burkholderia mallei NCTC 10247]EDK86658.1 hypothetical protein BMA721280_I0097 [Burkholderia mallei 2002721280]EEC34094.1 hypothetical protein BUC_4204 [Burkholderia pseudomallei 576]EEP49010.1 hypothetical protein GBP346_B2752 [Burkholderia pseudomallei MSHR346]EEP85536.1 hypothetical protein BMAGB8_A0094 [Burkholderia mallei GB8 horse 4]EES47077.1 hypothetical protein BMAPRL20_01